MGVYKDGKKEGGESGREGGRGEMEEAEEDA